MSFLSKNIRYLRGKEQIHIRDMAEKCGIPLELIGQLEEKLDESGIEYLVKISEFLNCSVEKLVSIDIEETTSRFRDFNLEMLVMDVDGVLTDGGMYYAQSGDEFKKFNTRDGLAIRNLVLSGKKAGFLSSGINNNIIQRRAELLGVQYVYVGTWDKAGVLEKWCNEAGISLSNVAYIGDDLNDLEVFDKVGISFCPSDAAVEIKKKATIVLSKKGGDGCVRELIEEYFK